MRGERRTEIVQLKIVGAAHGMNFPRCESELRLSGEPCYFRRIALNSSIDELMQLLRARPARTLINSFPERNSLTEPTKTAARTDQ